MSASALSRRQLFGGQVNASTMSTSRATSRQLSRSVGSPAADGSAAQVAAPSAADRHILSRFTFGITPAVVEQAGAAGGARAWFEQQLDSSSWRSSGTDGMADWWPHLSWSAGDKFRAHDSGALPSFEQGNDFCRWTLLKRMTMPSQLHEVMTDFWGNLLFVSLTQHPFAHLPGYDRTIRAHALTTFEQLLTEAVLHPAMLVFLDAHKSTKKFLNENLGREVLELHTVGREAGYTEDDVLNSARILTGYRVKPRDDCKAFYDEMDHYVGAVKVLDFEHPNTLRDGREVTRAYLKYLANHEATAQRVARFLAQRFVSDQPSHNLVDTLARVFRESGTDIPTTLRALVDHPEFAAAAGVKVRTPVEDFVNTYRVLGIEVAAPLPDRADCAAVEILNEVTNMGQKPFDWPRPDGFPDRGDAWASASRMLGSWRVHKNGATGVFPKIGIAYKPTSYWLGELPVRFDELVDRISRLLLAKPADERLLQTAVLAVATQPEEIITPAHPVVMKRLTLLLQALLDSPDHMTR